MPSKHRKQSISPVVLTGAALPKSQKPAQLVVSGSLRAPKHAQPAKRVKRGKLAASSARLVMVPNSTAMGMVSDAVPSLPRGLIPLLGQFVDPAHYAPQRLPDVTSASTVGTAVCTLCAADTMLWDPILSLSGRLDPAHLYPKVPGTVGGDSYVPLLSDQEARLVVSFRDPVCLGVITTGPFELSVPTQLDSRNIYGDGLKLDAGDMDLELGFIYASGANRYGNIQIPARVSGGTRAAMWYDGADGAVPVVSIAISFRTQVAHGFMLELRVHFWHDEKNCVEEWVDSVHVVPGDLSCSFGVNGSFPCSGYRSFQLHVEPDDPTSFLFETISGVVVSATVSTQVALCHVFHPSILDAAMAGNAHPLIGQARQLGNTVLISNNTAEMFKSGTVYARQVDGTVPWYQCALSPADITSANVHTMYDGPLAKGLYAIVKPQGVDCLSLEDVVIEAASANDTAFGLNFRPFSTSGTVVALLMPSHPTPNTPATSMVVHFFRGMEFTTQSQLFNVDVCNMPRATLLPFLDELSHFRQFYENPLHMRDITDAIKNAGKWAWDNRGTIKEIAKLLAEAASIARAAAVAA